MKNVSRRTFIVGASAGAAGVALGAGAPALVTAIGSSTSKSAKAAAVTGPVMAYAIDPAKGDVILLNGGKKVTVHDPDLAQRLVNAVAQ